MNQMTESEVEQHTVNLARVNDEWFSELPDDLYIPPEAFAIMLERFEGPLDFLLYLVKKNGLDLVKLDIAPIASQYLAYIKLMHQLDIELAGDYLVMAALLADLKSRLLLPAPKSLTVEDDPRQSLLARLEEYARIKQGAALLNDQLVEGRDVFAVTVGVSNILPDNAEPEITRFNADILQLAMRAILSRPPVVEHRIIAEEVPLEERIIAVRQALQSGKSIRFDHLLVRAQGRMGIVVTFMAILELLRQQEIEIVDDGLKENQNKEDQSPSLLTVRGLNLAA
ncbi:MAG: segregation/condensation protein A [Candidatus Saccharibacteria bacterium]|nr:segregation/condensation protein A [Moraxellaceae bacterium]